MNKSHLSVMNTPGEELPIASNLTAMQMSKALSDALKKNALITAEDTSIIFYDVAFLEKRIESLINLFPPDTLHAIAIKANPLTAILKTINALGVGLEAASLPELYLAQQAGFSPDKIVFDSPSKTREEIEFALRSGIYLNADSFAEVDRIAEILKNVESKSTIGIRINPQIGSGSIASTSVAGTISKFGIPLNSNRDKLKAYYQKYNWLKGIHVHIGSQGCPVDLMVAGIRKVLDFAHEVNAGTGNQIAVFDMGGGLAVSYHPDKVPVAMEQYQLLLRENFEELFNGQFRVITEFGRYVHANAGWVASKVEYVKREEGYNIAMTHVGADLFLRKAYNPTDWHHQITVVDKTGKLKTGADKYKYIVAGPLCFAGDIIARDLELPVVEEGDYILIHDAGAYTLSMWSRYNSRQIPKVIGYDEGGFEVLKEREAKEELLKFWS